MRIVTALAIVVVNVGLGWSVAAGPAAADGLYPLSQCYTATVSNLPTDVQPGVTVCQP